MTSPPVYDSSTVGCLISYRVEGLNHCQKQLQGTPERITIPTASSWIELDAITGFEGYKRLWLWANGVVHKKFARCARFPAFKPGSRKAGAVNKRRNAPRSRA